MSYKKVFLGVIAVMFLFVMIVFSQQSSEQEIPLAVAACPTFYYILDSLEESGVKAVRTSSTKESIYYLSKNKVDLIISGRVLKPEEPDLYSKVIGPGYSFVSHQEQLVFDEEMGDYDFFTDLYKEKIVDNFPYIADESLREVEEVYDYLEKGIVITSAENTDYSKSEVVHVHKKDGSRHRFSRTPIAHSQDINNIDRFKVILKDRVSDI